MAKHTDIFLRNQMLYSVYVRSHSKAGTFQAVTADLDRIRALGATILWLMPIHPIGEEKRLGTLGSPYAIRDYRAVNPEYGTLEDFRQLVSEARKRGMKCIIDVVYNHTSPDSVLAAEHPEYFYIKPGGGMGNRMGEWFDVADLDYSDRNLWQYQIDTLKQWAKEVDGFRCDVAPLVPLEFWFQARQAVEAVNPDCIWLSESSDAAFLKKARDLGFHAHSDAEEYSVFDICYDYDIMSWFTGYLKGEIPLSRYVEMLMFQETMYPHNYVKLRSLENHDNKRARKLIPDTDRLVNFTAFLFFQRGLTHIYAGQEAGDTNRPHIAEKDPVNWDNGLDLSPLIAALAAIKQDTLFSVGSCDLTADDRQDAVIGIYRQGGKQSVGVFSLKGRQVTVPVPVVDGIYPNRIDGKPVTVSGGRIETADPVILIIEQE